MAYLDTHNERQMRSREEVWANKTSSNSLPLSYQARKVSGHVCVTDIVFALFLLAFDLLHHFGMCLLFILLQYCRHNNSRNSNENEWCSSHCGFVFILLRISIHVLASNYTLFCLPCFNDVLLLVLQVLNQTNVKPNHKKLCLTLY